MHFELDLAIAYACALSIFGLVASWLVPYLFGAIVRGLASAIRSLQHHAASDQAPKASTGGGHDYHDWWGPTHHSQ